MKRSTLPKPWPAAARRGTVLDSSGHAAVQMRRRLDGAAPALRRLAAALDGRLPPCAEYPAAWIDDVRDAADAEAAEEACLGCAAMLACGEYAEALGADDGVWGGRYRGARRRRGAS